MQEIIQAALADIAFILCGVFLAYVVLIVVPFLRHRPQPTGVATEFRWHYFIPCLNEQLVIEATVRSLLADFPSAHVWCIDDASNDLTPVVLARLEATYPHVHLVRRHLPEARQGKGPALNAAWRAMMSSLPAGIDHHQVIVGVLDADGHLDPRCPEVIAGPRYFQDASVGAVQVRVRIDTTINEWAHQDHALATSLMSRLLLRLQDMEFTTVLAAMQMLRRGIGSVGMGGNGQFTRLSVLNQIAGKYQVPWHGALLEDFELGLHLLLSGTRNEYCHDSWVLQEGLPTLRRLVRQRSRWAQGSLQCFRYLIPVLRSREISTAGALEISYFLFLPWINLIGDLVFLSSVGLIVTAFVVQPAWLSSGTWGLFTLFAFFAVFPLAIWGPIYRRRTNRTLGRTKAVFLGLANWPYTYLYHAALWWAFVRILRSRHDWKKTDHAGRIPVLAAEIAASGELELTLDPLRGAFVVRERQPAEGEARSVVKARFIPRQSVGTASPPVPVPVTTDPTTGGDRVLIGQSGT